MEEVRRKMILEKVNFYTGRVVDNYIYASMSFFNGLIKINMNTYEADYISKFPNEKMIIPVLHRFSYLYKRNIFFIPCDADNVAVFNVDDVTITNIEISQYTKKTEKQMNYFVVDNMLWLVPVINIGKAIVINMDNYEVESKEMAFFKGTILNIWQDNNWIYFINNNNGEIISYNVESKEVIKEKTSVYEGSTISKMKDGIWVSNVDSFLKINNNIRKYYSLKQQNKINMFVNMIDFEGGTYAVPYNFKTFLIKKDDADYFEEVEMRSLQLNKVYSAQSLFSYDLIEVENEWILPNYNINKMIAINKYTGAIDAIELRFEKEIEICDEEIRDYFISEIRNENIPIDLNTYINAI